MQTWSALLGALIGGAVVLGAQLLSHSLTRKRDGVAAMRRLAAQLLAQGRVVQHVTTKGRRDEDQDVAQLTVAVQPFIEAYYELKWTAPPELRVAAGRYVDSCNSLIQGWQKSSDRLMELEQAMVDAANDLEATVTRVLRLRDAH